MVKASGTITLTRVNDGATGATGNGIVSVTLEYYLSTSKTIQTGGGWASTAPSWSVGKYMWTRSKSTYTNGTTTYSNPICDTSWEVVNDLETKITKDYKSAIDLVKDSIMLSVEQTTNSLLSFKTNLFNDCVKCLEKTTSETTVKKLQDMPIGIDVTTLRNRDICISVDVVASNVTMKSLGNYAGAWFTVTYTDNTTKTYKAVFVPGAIYLENTLSGITKSINQRLYATYRIDDKVVKSVSALALEINLNGNIRVANPKVEFGIAPSGLEFSQKDQEIRLQKTELLLTPTEITALVNERIGADGELKTMKFVLNKDGGEFYDGALSIFNKANEKVLYADTNGNLTIKNLYAIDGTFSGVIDSSIIKGGTIEGSNIRTEQNAYIGASIYMKDNGDKYDSRAIYMKNGWITYNGNVNGDISMMSISTYNDSFTNTAAVTISNSSTLSYVILSAKKGSQANELGVYDNYASTKKNFTVEGALTVYGAKNRLVEDFYEGKVLLNAVESTEPVFEDYGTAMLDEEGKCVIRLDKRFLATVNAKQAYYVFLTKLGEGDLFVKNKYNFAFIVHGTPNLKFDWRITAKQRDYEDVRMDEYVKEKS